MVSSASAFIAAVLPALREHRRTCPTAFFSRPDPFNLGPGWVTKSTGKRCKLCDALAMAEESGLVSALEAWMSEAGKGER